MMWRAIKKYLHTEKLDLIILIDFPDTHFRLLKTAKKLGIPVLYYVSPQVWAWRPGRLNTLKKYVAHMAVLFSFEEKIYRAAGIPVTFVGHPLCNVVKPTLLPREAYHYFHLNAQHPIIALLPGSRHSELSNHLPLLINSAQKIATQYPQAQFVLVLAAHFKIDMIAPQLPSTFQIVQGHLYDLLQITTAAIAVSGTVTLEVALMQVPLCIIYKMNPLTYFIAKRLIRTPYIGLCNIVAQNKIAQEFIQDGATPDAIAGEIIRLLSDAPYYQAMQSAFSGLSSKISTPGQDASATVADIALDIVSSLNGNACTSRSCA
jgi:lipid-A-disaccharide synthase